MFDEFLRQKEKSLEHVSRELLGIRGSRAVPGLVEDIPVEAYGSTMPVKQLASVSIPEPRTIAISAWDKQMTSSIAKALEKADLGAMPTISGEVIHVTLPTLTAERREKLIKLIGNIVEEGRIALRRIREETLSALKTQKEKGELSEDSFFRLKEDLEKAISEGNDKLEELREAKERELSSG